MSSNSNGGTGLSSNATLGGIPNVGSNSYNFSTGLGDIDPNQNLDSLSSPLMGANAGTIPNGFTGQGAGGALGNFTPSGSLSGISSGSLNGNTSFAMPADSTAQLQSQSLNANNLSNALAGGAKVAQSQGQQPGNRGSAGNAKEQIRAQNFSAPIANFGGSVGGSQAGNSLLQLLSKYRPGTSS